MNTAHRGGVLAAIHALGLDDVELVRQAGVLDLVFEPFARRIVADAPPGFTTILAVHRKTVTAVLLIVGLPPSAMSLPPFYPAVLLGSQCERSRAGGLCSNSG